VAESRPALVGEPSEGDCAARVELPVCTRVAVPDHQIAGRGLSGAKELLRPSFSVSCRWDDTGLRYEEVPCRQRKSNRRRIDNPLTGRHSWGEPYRVLRAAAQLTRSARTTRLRIDRTWRWAAHIAEGFHRLRAHSPDQSRRPAPRHHRPAPACPPAAVPARPGPHPQPPPPAPASFQALPYSQH
jgi:hypothetical protein